MTQTYSPADRRPIASRKHRLWVAAAHWLCQAGISANAISIAGMICAIVAGFAAWMTSYAHDIPLRLLWLAVAAGCQLRLLANMFDGMVAIESQTASPVGELYNEIPDRVSDAAVLLGLGYAAGGSHELGYIATILAIITAYVRGACKIAGAPQDYCGPMAKPHRMFLVTLMAIYLAVAPLSWHITSGSQAYGIPAYVLILISIGCAITALRRLLRGSSQLRRTQP